MSPYNIKLCTNIKKTQLTMTNAPVNIQKSTLQFDVEPLLAKVMHEAYEEHQKLQEVFGMMGWGNLPDALKIEIKDDVTAMVNELEGRYSTCDPHVLKRRQSVTYWVKCFKGGICSLKTAVDAVKMTKL